MFTVYLIKVVWEFGLETLMFALALIKCCWLAKSKRKLFYKINIELKLNLFERYYSLDTATVLTETKSQFLE